MPQQFDDAGALAEWLVSQIQHSAAILIDGFPDAGKSTLAKLLGEHLMCSLSHLDELRRGQIGEFGETYADALDHSRLENLARSDATLIVEGVTVLDVAKFLPHPTRLHVYVKRRMRVGLWVHETEIRPILTLDAEYPPTPLGKLVRDYHGRTIPHEICDAVYSWTDSE